MYGVIYRFTNKVNRKMYIGRTVLPIHRRIINGHYRQAFACDSQTHFHKALRKYGKENFSIEVLEAGIDNNELLNEKEIYYIAFYDTYKNGYNSTLGGEGTVGYKWTEETYDYFRSKFSGEGNPFYNKKHTDITKTIISSKAKERMKNPENNPMYGKRHTEKSKQKISNANKGIIPWNKGKNNFTGKPVLQLDKERNIINEYISAKEAERQTGIFSTTIAAVCKGKRKSAGGFMWRYVG